MLFLFQHSKNHLFVLKPNFVISIFVASQLFMGCVASQNLTDSTYKVNVADSPVFKQNHTGFALYDLEKQQVVSEYQSDKYFLPASNTKLFTFYAALCMLGDSTPALKYVIRHDSLIFWGTGDPTLLHPDLPQSKVLEFLKNWNGKLFVARTVARNGNERRKRFGYGWAWDDYNGYYSAEINELPIYGNIVRFEFNSRGVNYKPQVQAKDDKESFNSVRPFLEPGHIEREESRNKFEYIIDIGASVEDRQDVPFITSEKLFAQLLADTLHRSVELADYLTDEDKQIKTVYSLPLDVVYRRMLQQSDNMLAEQVLMLCASTLDSSNVTLSSSHAIEYAKSRFLTNFSDSLTWVDGSGMSRYNLFTPRSIVQLLQKIYMKVPQERLFNLLAIGGKTGTLKNSYKADVPFVFGKTGSYSNNYSLSGYLKTKSGKILLFSFMNNNFTGSTSVIRREVQRILTEVHEKY